MTTNPDTSKAWPHFMLRYMMQADETSFNDLIWSVGGSPPYGAISYEEAGAVYELIEDYRGKGEASAERFEAVRRFVDEHPERERVLDLFQCYDRIVSASDSYSQDAVDEGLAIARSTGDQGTVGLFTLFHAGILSREGRNAAAADLTLEALDSLLLSAEENPASRTRVEQAAQNAVALTAMGGDLAKATQLLETLSEVMPDEAATRLQRWIAAQKK